MEGIRGRGDVVQFLPTTWPGWSFGSRWLANGASSIFTNIIQERQEEEEQVKKEKIVNLEELSMGGVNLIGVESDTLAGGVVKIKKVNLAGTHCTAYHRTGQHSHYDVG